jgi:predicted nucleic acid-binding protein
MGVAFDHDINRIALIRGENLNLMPCYPDTNVLVNAFLENSENLGYSSCRENVEESKAFFNTYDGPHLFTSPIVLAEFVHVSVKKFSMTFDQAIQKFETIFKEQKFSMRVPQIELHSAGRAKLPPIYDYSMRLDGTAKCKDVEVPVSVIYEKGFEFQSTYFNGKEFFDANELYEKARWKKLALCQALTDVLLEGTFRKSSVSGKIPEFQDTLVLSFARGFQYTHFVTCDNALICRLRRTSMVGDKIMPFPDVEVVGLCEYNTKYFRQRRGNIDDEPIRKEIGENASNT